MRVIKSIVNYFFLGVKTIFSSKIAVLVIFCLGIYFINNTKCYKEELKNASNELEKYEDGYLIEKMDMNTISYYSDDNLDTSNLKSIAASDLISCINEKLDINSLDSESNKIIKELNDLYNMDNEHFSFLYKDIYTGFTISYNEKGAIFTASSIKAPAMIYLYEMASKNKINLDEELTYTKNFYSKGSGRLKYMEFNTKHKVRDLIKYTIYDSDNAAYKMLINRYGRTKIYNFWDDKGTGNIFKQNTVWGKTSAHDAGIYMQELYDFYLENDEYGEELMSLFKKAGWKQVSNKDGKYNTANKGGWSGKAFHDAAIVFEENPYILVVFSNTGESDYNYLFKNTSKLVGQFHEKYWEQKMNQCSNIKQY